MSHTIVSQQHKTKLQLHVQVGYQTIAPVQPDIEAQNLKKLPWRNIGRAKDGNYLHLWPSMLLVAVVTLPLLSSSDSALLLWLLCLLAALQNKTPTCYCHHRGRKSQGSTCEASVIIYSLNDCNCFNCCEFSETDLESQNAKRHKNIGENAGWAYGQPQKHQSKRQGLWHIKSMFLRGKCKIKKIKLNETCFSSSEPPHPPEMNIFLFFWLYPPFSFFFLLSRNKK